MFSLSMSFISCEDVLGHWEKPVKPTVEEVIKYGFKVTDLAGVDRTEAVTSLKMTKADGTLVAEAEVSADHKITIKNTDLSAAAITAAADFWFEATVGTDKYIAKVNIDPTTLSPESDKTLEMATLGDVILADGTFAVSTADTKVAVIAYVGSDACEAGDAPYNHGLALALKDDSDTRHWRESCTETCLGTQYDESGKFNDLAGIANTDALVGHAEHDHRAAKYARNFKYDNSVAEGTHPDGTSAWFLPSAGQWNKMVTAAGGYATLQSIANLTTGYWSSTEVDANTVWCINDADGNWSGIGKGSLYLVRACLAF